MRFARSNMLQLAGFATLLFAATAQATPQGWDLAWNDEFNFLDGNKWTRVFSNTPTNNSLHTYLPQQVTVSNGNLVITSENIPANGNPYRSGQVISKMERTYGRWEVRADLPTSKGMWPAIWLLPRVNQWPWPSGGEIDIMENRGDQPNLTSSAFHYGTNPPFNHNFVFAEQETANGGQLDNYHTGFHEYAVEWESDQLRFYVDDVHHWTVYDEDVGGFLSSSVAPMETIINTAVGGHFLDDPDGSTVWPQQMLVDYVRVYDKNPATFVQTFDNGGFDDSGGSLAGWSTFGNDIPNVGTHSEAVLDGGNSLKLFGQFNGGLNFSGVTQELTVEAGDEVIADASAFIRSADSIAGTGNSVQMKIEFYDEHNAKFGSSNMLGEHVINIADGTTTNNVWLAHQLSATAPAGTAVARLAFVFTQPSNQGGAVHIDGVSFAVASTLPADFDGDGDVDLDDFNILAANFGDTNALPGEGDADGDGDVDLDDFNLLAASFGSSGELAGALPEPGAGAVLLLTSASSLVWRRRASR